MYYKNGKRNKQVSKVYQSEDRNERFDYDKTRVDILSGIIGYREKIRDSRWLNGKIKWKDISWKVQKHD